MYVDIVRAWKDPEYRNSLTEGELAMLPSNPAGMVELSDSELEEVDGGSSPVCSAILSLVTMALCFSILGGGTCQVQTSGCCPAQELT